MGKSTALKMAGKVLYGKPTYTKAPQVIESELQMTSVFVRNFECQKRFVLNRGGAGSSKSHSLAQLLTYKFLNEKQKSILIVRKSLPYLKISTLPLVYKVWDSMRVRDRIREEKLMLNYYYKDNWMHFGSIDDSEKLKCHSEDSDILTAEGFKPIKDVKVGELVATMDPVTRQATYMPVTNVYSYHYNGKMIKPKYGAGFRRPHTDFCVTPNHKMLTKTACGIGFSFVEAGKLPDKYIIPQSSKWSFGTTQEEWETANKSNLKHYLKQLGLNNNKQCIPRDILNLHPDMLAYLFRYIIKQGGGRVTNKHFIYYTDHKQLADDVSELAIKLGYVVSIRNVKSSGWVVDIAKRADIMLVNKEEVDYNGNVYCVEVIPYHTVLTRYNGKIAWTGNSSEWNYIWVEEATELTLQDFKVLRTRLRAPSIDGMPNQMFLSFNPTDEKHWIKRDVLDKINPNKVEEIHSTYRDNPFLDEDSKAELEDLVNQDKNFWRIMALGEWGRLENIIFNNWDNTAEEIPKEARVIYGVDFGFNQPSALVKLGYIENDIWLQELIYETRLDNSQFIKKIKEKIPAEFRYCPIYCDSAEPDRVQEMVSAHLNAKLADKKIKEGIDLMKRYKLHILKDSVNIVKEISSYVYQTDKNGDPKDIPINWDDHALSAIRYAIYSHLKRGRQYKVRWL